MAISGSDIIAFAKQYVGTPYVWGGNSLTNGVDCSGLVQQVYKNFGLSVPRVTYDQIGEGKAVKMNELQPGDMVFFDTNPSVAGPDHVGLYMGDGKMLHAPKPGKPVQITDMTNGYYQNSFMGGRRISGITGGGPSGDWTPGGGGAQASLSPEELAASYGWAHSFLNSNGELKGLFEDAVEDSWSPDMFQAKLRETEWWKENSASMRKAALEKGTDPATYEAKVEAAKLQITTLGAEMGASIPGKKLGKIAESVIKTGLDEAGLRNILGKYVDFTKNGTLKGAAGMYEHSMKEFAYQQGVSLDRDTVKKQAQLIVRGLATDQDFRNQIVNQAASAYPSYKVQLEGGQTMMDIASPYIQQMSEDLEIPYQTISLSDPLIRQALNGVDSTTKKPTGMDVVSFQNLVRSDPRWGGTQNAQDKVMETGIRVMRDMGLVGG